MDQPQIYSKLATAFRQVFDEDDLKLTPQTTADRPGQPGHASPSNHAWR